MVDQKALHTVDLLIDYSYGICITFGRVFNALIIVVCVRTALRRTPTFVFIAFGALSNSVLLFVAPLNHFLDRFVLHVDPRNVSLLWCRLSYYFKFSFIYWSVWLLVFSILEIYLTVKMINFRPKFSNSRYAVGFCLGLGAFSLLINIPKLFLQGVELDVNGTSKVICWRATYSSKKVEMLGTAVNSIIFVFLPTILIFFLNILLFAELKRTKSKCTMMSIRLKSKMKLENRRIAKTQLMLALLFLSVSLPLCVSIAAFIMLRSELAFFFVKLCALVFYAYFSSTLLLLLIHNRTFKQHFFSILMMKKPIEAGSSTK